LLDDPEPGSTWFISLVSTVIFIAFVLAIISFYFRADGIIVGERVIDANVKPLTEMKAQQHQLLSDYRAYQETLPDGKTVDRIRIPIDRAMELVAADLASKPRVNAEDAAR